MKHLFYILTLLITVVACKPTKIACVGDSITYGATIQGRDSLGYPQQMQKMLGKKYQVKNFGVNGATMLKKGDKPYWDEPQYKEALQFNPDIVIITLGTNDSKPFNWDKYKVEFKKNYLEMISNFQNLKSKPQIYIGVPPPVIKDKWGIRREIVEDEIPEILNEIAKEKNVKFIDYYSILSGSKALFPDGIHPNADGARRMAIIAVSRILTTY